MNEPTLNDIIIKLHDIARERDIPELRKVADDICQIEKRIRNQGIKVATEARSHAIL